MVDPPAEGRGRILWHLHFLLYDVYEISFMKLWKRHARKWEKHPPSLNYRRESCVRGPSAPTFVWRGWGRVSHSRCPGLTGRVFALDLATITSHFGTEPASPSLLAGPFDTGCEINACKSNAWGPGGRLCIIPMTPAFGGAEESGVKDLGPPLTNRETLGLNTSPPEAPNSSSVSWG